MDRYYLDILTLKTEMQFRKYSFSTQETYTRVVKNFLQATNKEAVDITKKDVIKYLDNRLLTVSTNTVLVELNALQFFFWEILGLDIIEYINNYKREFKQAEYITMEELNILSNSVRLRDKVIYRIIIETGFNVYITSILKVSDLSYAGNYGMLKGKLISTELTKLIVRYIDRYELTDNLFNINDQGIRYMNRVNCSKYLTRYYTFNNIRHAIALEMIKKGELTKAQEYLGYKDLYAMKQYFKKAGYEY